jgi:hypothetical protein
VLKSLTGLWGDFRCGTDGQRVKRAEMLSGVMRTVGGVAILGWFMRILREFGVDIDSMVLTVGSGGMRSASALGAA